MYLGIVEILVEYEGNLYGIGTTDDGVLIGARVRCRSAR